MNEHMREIGPLLTAYAEDALAPEGRAWVDAQLALHPELRERLAAIRSLAQQLRSSLPAAPTALSAERRMTLLAYACSPRPPRVRIRYIVAMATALVACVVVALLAPFNQTIETLRTRGVPFSHDDMAQAAAASGSDGLVAAKAPAPIRGVWEIQRRQKGIEDEVQQPLKDLAETTGDMKKSGNVTGTLGGAGFDPDNQRDQPENEENRTLSINEVELNTEQESTPGMVDLSPSTEPDARKLSKHLVVSDLPKMPLAAPDTRFPGNQASINGLSRDFQAQPSQQALDRLAEAPEPAMPSAPAATPAPTTPPPPIEDSKREKGAEQSQQAQDADQLAVGDQEHFVAAQTHPDRDDAADKERMLEFRPSENKPQELDGRHARVLEHLASMLAVQLQQRQSAGWTSRGLLALRSPVGVDDAELLDCLTQPGRDIAEGPAHAAISGLPQKLVRDQANDRPLGALLVGAAQRHGLQLVLQGGSGVLRAGCQVLDPTELGGWPVQEFRDAFATSPMLSTAQSPRLTFAFDADTASFDQARTVLARGRMPDPGAIAPEQFINAMNMGYPAASGPEAVALYAEGGPSPFATGALAGRTALVALGVVTRAPDAQERRPLHLTLAVDTSGSMGRPDGLELVKIALRQLAASLKPEDSVCLVRFADQASIALPPTPGDQGQRITAAIDALESGGVTDSTDGLALAYQLAGEQAGSGQREVLLATDGASLEGPRMRQLMARIDQAREHGIGLLVLGCGSDDRQQRVLQSIADRAHGSHSFIADADAARAFGSALLPSHLQVLAQDVKIQVAWNPSRVAYSRLIGFDQRRLADREFRQEGVDAGALAHDVQATALFEVVLAEDGTGPVGEAHLRCFDTRAGEIREQAFAMPGSILQVEDGERLHRLACAAELAEMLQQGWWSNVRCTSWERLISEIDSLPASADSRTLLAMAVQARNHIRSSTSKAHP